MPFQFQRLRLPGLLVIEAQRFGDDRGFFAETYKLSDFVANGIAQPFVQDNYSHSSQGIIRGLHYQKQPRAQGKLIMVISGTIYDVAVDIRAGSATYGQWEGLELSGDRLRMLYVPVGFAHGFCVLSQTADVLYKVTEQYDPDLDRGILWNDPEIGIEWPITEPILSPKDTDLPLLRNADNNFEVV